MIGAETAYALDHPDQWGRCWHDQTSLSEGGGIELAYSSVVTTVPCGSGRPPAGLAFDRWCRGYVSRPDRGRVDVVALDGDLPADDRQGTFDRPTGIAVDGADRLYVAERCAHRVAVIDLPGRRLLKRIEVRDDDHPRRAPVDVAPAGCCVLVLCRRPDSIVVIAGRRGPRPGPPLVRPRCARRLTATRIAVAGPVALVLWTSARGDRSVVATVDGDLVALARGATDIELTDEHTLVVARGAGQPLLRFRRVGARWDGAHALRALDYDGAAICRAPDGRIAYTTSTGWAFTSTTAERHVTRGRLVTFRIDSGRYANRWGRLLVDACVPPGASLRCGFVTTDLDDVEDPLPASPAVQGASVIKHPDDTPPLPSTVAVTDASTDHLLHRRAQGREWPWAQIDAEDGYETYETPVAAATGRYLWVILDLAGTAAVSPKVRTMRVETGGHSLLDQLPHALAPAPVQADFLHRFLTPAYALLDELDERAATRDLLLHPAATPQESLSWLASLAGLVLDRRWPLAARRTLVAEAYRLFALRGTIACLERILEIYLGRRAEVVENWRLRGLGGAVLGVPPPGPEAPSVLGGLRTGGQLGKFTVGGQASRSSYSSTAHRFTIVVPITLDPERREVVRAIADAHKPAHTTYTLCELGEGMRVGRGARISLTTLVGPGAGWDDTVLGTSMLGAGGVVGTPAIGARLGATSLSQGVRVG